jgi:hypothetical protein
LQVQSGYVVKTVDTTLDWMYEGPSSGLAVQQSSEEYLLGKIYKPQAEKSNLNSLGIEYRRLLTKSNITY